MPGSAARTPREIPSPKLRAASSPCCPNCALAPRSNPDRFRPLVPRATPRWIDAEMPVPIPAPSARPMMLPARVVLELRAPRSTSSSIDSAMSLSVTSRVTGTRITMSGHRPSLHGRAALEVGVVHRVHVPARALARPLVTLRRDLEHAAIFHRCRLVLPLGQPVENQVAQLAAV